MNLTRYCITALAGVFAASLAQAQDKAPPLAPLPAVPNVIDEGGTVDAEVAPADVLTSAVEAVAALGEQIVLGRYQVAIDRMNPAWKERAASQLGGIEELQKQLAAAPRKMVQEGVSIISFKPQGKPRSFEVGKKVARVGGDDGVKPVLNQWLVFVPTVTRFRIQTPNGKASIIESVSFQVAVSDKGTNVWTFIDGGTLSVNDLRGLYFTLPADLRFPPVEKHEVK